MNKVITLGMLIISAYFLVGCSSKTPQVPLEPMSEKLRFEKITFHFDQKYPTKIQYQSPAELEKRINDKIMSLMNEKGLVSSDTSMNALRINIHYIRRFVGQDFPIQSLQTESLMPPLMAFDIHVINDKKEIRTVAASDLIYNGDLFANLNVMAGTNRDNDYENKAADALAKETVDRIEKLK